MPRRKESKNQYYNYELILGDTTQYKRTLKCIAINLDVSLSTVKNYLKNPEKCLRKYKNKNLKINKVKIPIYQKPEKILVIY